MRVEAKVGILFIVTALLMVGFAYYLGALNPFSNSHELYITYNFAGGIEEGSSVRVMGIKVGRVQEIAFDPSMKDENGKEVKLKIKISISKKAWTTVKKDSQFYINLAGVIGEKFLEVTPGSHESPPLEPGATIRGIDPPRIDQLISQSYGLAGKILELVEQNEGTVVGFIDKVDRLLGKLNRTLSLLEKAEKNQDVVRLMKNMVKITDGAAHLADNVKGAEAQKTIKLLHRLIWRLDELDGPQIRKFLQEEGIKAKMF